MDIKKLCNNIRSEDLVFAQEEYLPHESPNDLNSAFVNMSNSSCLTVTTDVPLSNIKGFGFSTVDEGMNFECLFAIKTNAVGSNNVPLKFLKICTPAVLPLLVYLYDSKKKIIETSYSTSANCSQL